MSKKSGKSARSIAIVTLVTGVVGTIGFGGQSVATTGDRLPVQQEQSLTLTTSDRHLQVARKQNISALAPDAQDVQNRRIQSVENAQKLGLEPGMPYQDARELLLDLGWEPNWQGESPNLTSSAVQQLFDLGYEEIKDCSGTGEAPCRFEFINSQGKLLVVVTTPMGSPNATEQFVRNWWIEESTANPEILPFIGTRAFNFLGGSGTGQTITIEADGTTTVELHGTQTSSVQYRGKFTNPIVLDNGFGILLEDNTVYQLNPDGEIAQNCREEGSPCEAQLYEPRAKPE